MVDSIKNLMEKYHYWILTFIFICAVCLRMIGINWGMPYGNLHPDEDLIFGQAYQCVLHHNFEVKEYYRPNHVTIKLNVLAYTAIQELYFEPQNLHDFSTNYANNFSLFTTVSRIITALFGIGVVILAYKISSFFGKNVALFTTALFAVFPAFIEHSHYITPDIPLLFFMLGVLLFALHYIQNPTISSLFWMSFLASLAVCEKYPGVYGCVIIAVAVIIVYIKRPIYVLKNGLLAILFFIVGILAVSPVLIIDYRTVLEVMEGQNKQYHIGADGLNFPQTIWYYIKTSSVHVGMILSTLGVYGLVKSIRKNSRETILLCSFFLYLIPISTLKVHWERYTLPVYSVALFFGALGAAYLLEDIMRRQAKKKWTVIAAALVVVVLPIGSLSAGAMAMSGSFLAPDSRIFTQDIMDSINVTKDNTVFDCNTPLDPGGFHGAFSMFENADPELFKYGSGPRFIMTSSAQRDLYLDADPDTYGWIANFYNKLDENYPLVFMFSVENPSSHFLEIQNIWYSARSVYRYMRGASKGYEIRLYQLKP